MTTARPRFLRAIGAATASVALLGTLTACGSAAASGSSSEASGTSSSGTTTVQVAALAGAPYTGTAIDVPVVASIRDELPQSVKDSGQLTIGVGALPSGFAPLAYIGTDQQTLTGSEPDFGRLVAAVFGLKPVVNNSTWDNLFVGIDSQRSNVGFSNITDTEKRKEKYDFASYRQDNLAFEVKDSSSWNFDNNYENLAGLKLSVSSGTNQEKILLAWKDKLKAEGKDFTVQYFPDDKSVLLALQSGRIDGYFGPNPTIAYTVAQTKSTAGATRTAGTFSGAGATLQGLIAATTKKDDGLVKPLADAINYLIQNGQYAAWLKAYNLSNEAVKTSEVNPAGLPLTNS